MGNAGLALSEFLFIGGIVLVVLCRQWWTLRAEKPRVRKAKAHEPGASGPAG